MTYYMHQKQQTSFNFQELYWYITYSVWYNQVQYDIHLVPRQPSKFQYLFTLLAMVPQITEQYKVVPHDVNKYSLYRTKPQYHASTFPGTVQYSQHRPHDIIILTQINNGDKGKSWYMNTIRVSSIQTICTIHNVFLVIEIYLQSQTSLIYEL